MSPKLKEAMRLHRQGAFDKAELIYRNFLSINSTDPIAIHFFGLLRLDQGFTSEALDLIQKSLALNPRRPEFHLNYAAALSRNSQFDRAIESYQRCLIIDSSRALAHLGLAQSLCETGVHEKSISHFLEAAKSPELTEEATLGLVKALRLLNRTDEALMFLSEHGNTRRTAFAKASLLFELQRFDDAIPALAALVRDDPHNFDVLIRFAVSLLRKRLYVDALTIFNSALEIKSDSIDALCGRAEALIVQGCTDEAIRAAQSAVNLDLNRAESYLILGHCLNKARRFVEAIEVFDKAISIREDLSAAKRNVVCALLHAGFFEEGWRRAENRHEWHDALPSQFVRASSVSENWVPISIGNLSEKVLVIGEHGLGDEIMFGSLLSEYVARQPNIVVQIDRRLIPLFSRSHRGIEFISHEDPQPPVDRKVRLGSLPALFRNRRDDFTPNPKGFLLADPARTATIAPNKSIAANTRLCGLSWKTINPFDDGLRSVDIIDFCTALKTKGWCYVNLQYSTTTEEWSALRSVLGASLLETSIDLFNDIDGVASMIELCDVVVTTGNSVAHLAGALGRLTYTLIPYSPSWRWFGDTNRSLWYSSIELIRQTEPGNWDQPLRVARERLAKHAEANADREAR